MDFEFYPTPIEVIFKMVSPIKLKNRNILEPSAGKGDILDYITKDYCGADKSRIYAIEKDMDNVYILQGKGYKIIANDFLEYTPIHSFDLILMNPPFSNGDEHLLHAWEIIKNGDIVCLLNAETIKNPYTQRRKLLKNIIDMHGSVEYLGNCFHFAERKTDVNVALVRLHKESDDVFKIDFEGEKVKTPDFIDDAKAGNQVQMYDKIGSYLYAWEQMQQATIDFIKARKKLDFYASAFMTIEKITGIVNSIKTNTKNDMQTAFNQVIDEAKSNAWREIIANMGMDRYMTAKIRESFNDFCTAQGAMELNRENIVNLIKFMFLNSKNIMDRAVADLFDRFCSFDEKNKIYTEGWKTNSNYKVNKKLILPRFVRCEWGGKYSTNFNRYNEYDDIEKVMCYLSGISYEEMDVLKDEYKDERYKRNIPLDHYKRVSLKLAISEVSVGDNSRHESEFFYFRCYKKGTLHIEFKDENLWQRFNITAAEGKKTIGY